jgi:hypothetical protein
MLKMSKFVFWVATTYGRVSRYKSFGRIYSSPLTSGERLFKIVPDLSNNKSAERLLTPRL